MMRTADVPAVAAIHRASWSIRARLCPSICSIGSGQGDDVEPRRLLAKAASVGSCDATEAESVEGGPSGKTLKILIVEDNPADIALVKMGFAETNLDCDLTIACNGTDAIQLLSREFDLILLDLNLPRCDGFDVLTVIRQELGLQCPVVIFSTSNTAKDQKRALGLGANQYVVKPFSAMETFQAIAGIVERWCSGRSGSL